MQYIIKTISNMLHANNPTWLTILIAVVLVIVSFMLSPNVSMKLLELLSIKKKKQVPFYTKNHFLNHSIFDYFTINTRRLQNLNFKSEGKSNVVKDMLFVLFSVYQQRLLELVNTGYKITDKYEFKKLVHTTILMAEQECEQKWRELRIPLINDLIADYNQWHSQSAAFCQMAIYNFTTSAIYDNIPERMEEILRILETRFRVTVPDIERGLMDANGKYKGLKYESRYF